MSTELNGPGSGFPSLSPTHRPMIILDCQRQNNEYSLFANRE